jgi:hypothetical protein
MIVTDEQGTSEVHRDRFEISACQVLVWDSRSAVEASQLKTSHAHYSSIQLVYIREFAQHTLQYWRLRFKFLRTHQRVVIPVSTVELIEGTNTQYPFAVYG